MSDIADFDIERPIGEERPLPLYEPRNNKDPCDNRNQAQNLLRDIARAFRDVAQHEAPATPRENNYVHVRTFKGEEDEDPVEWVEAFERAADANNWARARKIKIASDHLAGITASWYNDQKDDLLYWDNDDNSENSFVQSFVKYFATTERRHQWQLELTSLKQKEKEKVDQYTYQLKNC